MAETRIIKKYPNRRLYDTEISKYITLEDVKKLVLDGVDFIVKDVKTEEDLTRPILLQIISEQEYNGEPIFSSRTLTQLIRFYGNTYQSAFAEYLQKSLEMFVDQQKQFQQQFQKTTGGNPLSTMQELTEKNLQMWKQLQDNFFQTGGFNTGNDDKKDENN